MKKLIIAMLAAATSIAVNAAAMDWSITKTVMDAGTTIASGNTVYFFLNSGSTTQSAVMSLYAAGTTDFSSLAADTGTLTSGKATGSFSEGAPSAAANAYYVVMSDDRMFMSSAADSIYDNLTSTGQWSSPSDTVASMSIIGEAKAGFTTAGWYTASAAVPEPTSGLLLLLGVAGLALRRRRA